MKTRISLQQLLTLSLHFLLLLLATACGKAPEKDSPPAWSSFPVVLYLDSSFPNTPESRSDLKDAMDFWEQRAGRTLFALRVRKTEPPKASRTNTISFESMWTQSPNIAGQTHTLSSSDGIQSATIVINSETPFCTGDCAGIDRQVHVSERRTFVHELGHFLGLRHSDDRTNAMYAEIQPGADLESLTVDQAALNALTSGSN